MNRFATLWMLISFSTWGTAAEPIPKVTAKATSAQVAKLFSAENLCTDVGLTDSGKGDGSKKLTTNVYFGGGCMWHTGYLPHGSDETPIVEFDLQKVYSVGPFHVWNNNGSPHRGFRDVAVMVSNDGQAWRSIRQKFQFAKAPKSDDYLGEKYEFQPAIEARFIRFHCENTHRQGGNPELAGLGKVRFYEAPKAPFDDDRWTVSRRCRRGQCSPCSVFRKRGWHHR
jgi:hypothetical protein